MLVQAVKDFGKLVGFKSTTNHNCIRCSREGSSSTTRKYAAGSLIADCTFTLYLKAWYTKLSTSTGGARVGRETRNHEDWDSETCIIFMTAYTNKVSCWDHAGGCRLSSQNLVVVHSRGGDYVQNISARQIYGLCKIALKNRLSSSTIKGSLGTLMPRNTEISCRQVFHIW